MRQKLHFCAPVVDYDALRKEVVTVFADRAAEVQGLVVKLQKTQRAAEQALDRYLWGGGSLVRTLGRSPRHSELPTVVSAHVAQQGAPTQKSVWLLIAYRAKYPTGTQRHAEHRRARVGQP